MDDAKAEEVPQPPYGRIGNQDVAPYSSLGHLSYAPATQTTVVTTTTTTTTHFPPLVLKAPRHLHSRDPKLYPLAKTPTPSSIRKFRFDIGGKAVCFMEADSVEQSISEYTEQLARLHSSRGTIRDTRSFTDISPQPALAPAISIQKHQSRPRSSTLGKRSPSPVSIAEASELATLQRRSKRSRQAALSPWNSFTTVSDSRPERLSSNTSFSSTAKDEGYSRPKRHNKRANTSAQGAKQAATGDMLNSSNLRAAGPPLSKTARCYGSGTMFMGISATPPVAETDLEPIEPQPELTASRSFLPPINTVVAQDASLPSPNLSPIPPSATLARRGSYGVFTEADQDDSTHASALEDTQSTWSVDQSQGVDPAFVSEEAASHSLKTPESEHGGLGPLGEPRTQTPTVMDIPQMLDTFDAMPEDMKTYLMYQFLRRCTKPTLQVVAEVVNPALKCDFLANLPLELSQNIVRYLDARSMCRAEQVSKKWRQIINSDEKAWKDLLDADGFKLPDGEIVRAVREGWGWQAPYGPDAHEEDIGPVMPLKGDLANPNLSSAASVASFDSEDAPSPPSSTRPKRKAAAKYATSNKRQKRRPTSSKSQAPAWVRSLATAQGPRGYADAAEKAVPNPRIGEPNLQSLHLYKSLYQRHHAIRKSWMQEELQPKHIAFRAHTRHVVTCLQFDAEKILTGSDDTNINVYDTKTGALRNRLEGHEGGVWALQYEGSILVSGSTDRSVRIWDVDKGKCLQVFQGHTSTVRCLVILKPAEIGKAADGTPIMMPKEPLIITGSRDSSLRVWKLPKVGDRSIFQAGPPADDRDNPYFVRVLTGHTHSVRAIAAHGDTLVSGSYDCTVRVWKISTGETMHRLAGHTQKVYSVVLDHERNRCISGSMDTLVKVWSLDSGQCLFNLEGHSSLVGLLDLSHDRLVSAAADSTLRIWDPENGQCKSTLSAHTGAITCFQHDGQKVISGSDRLLKMWDVKSGQCVRDLLTDLSGVWQVRFNDRRCVAAVQRNQLTYIEVLDFGATRDGVPASERGRRILVDIRGQEVQEGDDGQLLSHDI